MNWIKKDSNIKSVKDVVLNNWGITSTDEANEWFMKSRKGNYHVNNMDKAAELILPFREKTVLICGDYDADGVMSISILTLALKQAGFRNVYYKIPHRHSEGYGLNCNMVESFYNEHAEEEVCLITVDNGVTTFDPIDLAKSYGWTVVVTDHHLGIVDEEGNKILPNADVVVDPSFLQDSDFNDYCGAGLAYKLACEIIGINDARYLLAMAAVATLADMVTLREENYVFVRDGLTYLNREYAPIGLLTLVQKNNLATVHDADVAFKLGPQINAPGRLMDDGAEIAVALMLADSTKAVFLAPKLIEINEQRKALVNEAMEKVPEMTGGNITIEYIPGINPGIAGIVAGNICNKTSRPCIILTDSESDNTLITGSARSIPAINIKALFDEIAEHLNSYGGHPGAAGLSVKRDEFEMFKQRMINLVEDHHFDFTDMQTSYYDLEINACDVPNMVAELTKYAPYGIGNPRPVFKVSNFLTQECKAVSQNGIRLKSPLCNAIGFGLADKVAALNTDIVGKQNTLYGHLGTNTFRGISTYQVELSDLEVN